MNDLLVEHVLRAVECVPTGRVVSYGMIAELVGGTPRQIGSVMRFYGSNVAWWRVTNASGDLPAHLRTAAIDHWEREGITLKSGGHGCRIADHRVDAEAWSVAYTASVSDLPEWNKAGHRDAPLSG